MKQFLLCISLFLLTVFCHGQELRIVKDNINCTYGLKDNNGNWVIEPTYILIQEYNSGYFLVKNEFGDGLLSSTGESVIECKYDRFNFWKLKWQVINSYSSNRLPKEKTKSFFIIGTKGDRESLINSQGKVIYEMKVGASCERDFGENFLIHHHEPKASSYIDTSGNIIIDKIPGHLASFRKREYALVGDQLEYNSDIARGNVRLINRKGESLLDETFDLAMITTRDRICFEQDLKFGVMSITGEIIIPPVYQREIPLSNIDATPQSWVILSSTKKKGILKNNGDVLLEPIYDHILPVYGKSNVQDGWKIELNGKFGVVELDGNWIVPLKYDLITPFLALKKETNDFQLNFVVETGGKSAYLIPEQNSEPTKFYDAIQLITQHSYSYHHSIGLGLITKNNEKYGILNIDGSVHSECIYEGHEKRGTSQEHQFFYRDNELKEFDFISTGITERVWEPFLKLENEIIFENYERYVGLVLANSTYNRPYLRDRDRYNRPVYGNMFVVGRDSLRNLNIYNHLTSKQIKLKNIVELQEADEDRFQVRTRSNNYGIVDENGKIVFDTIYANIRMNRNSDFIWASKITSEAKYTWNLLDRNGKRIVKTDFDSPFEVNSGEILMTKDNLMGLFDSESFDWKISPEHFCLVKLFNDYYHVGTDTNKKGIINSDGKVVVLLIYDTIINLYTNCSFGGSCPPRTKPLIRWLLQKGDTEFLADQNGKLISSESAIRTFKSSLLFDDDSLYAATNLYASYPRIDYSPSLHFLRGLTMAQICDKRKAIWTNSILKSTVYDTINRIWEARHSNCQSAYYYVQGVSFGEQPQRTALEEQAKKSCDCQKSNLYYQNRGNLIYKLRSIGEQFTTIDISYQNQNYDWDHLRGQAPPAIPDNNHINIIERNGKAEYISLKDIFPNDDVLMEEFIISLKKRDDLALDCSSLENMLAMIDGNFSLSNQGVHLCLDQNNDYPNSVVDLIVPISNLAKHSESSWIVPILSK